MTDEIPPWATGVSDQMMAAMENKQPHAYASIALDGMLRACEVDAQGGRLEFPVAMLSISCLDRANLMLVFAEALCRLYNQRIDP
jgi:hypothetical protein